MARARGAPARFFASGAAQPTVRRPADAMLLAGALILLVGLCVAQPPGELERSLIGLVASLPGWLVPIWGFLYDFLAFIALTLVVVALATGRRVLAWHLLVAVVLAVLIALVAARIATGAWPGLLDAISGGGRAPPFPDARIMWSSAVVLTMAPELARPVWRAVRNTLLLGVLGALLAAASTPTGIVAGLVVAMIAAAAARLVFGTAAGRPTVPDVAASLLELGVGVERLAPAARQKAGVLLLTGTDPHGRQLRIKVYGRDAYDNQLVAKLWRAVWYRDGGPALELRRAQGAEHEALMTLLARNAGVATDDVVTAGKTVEDDAVLVLAGEGVALGGGSTDAVDDALIADAWELLARLHAPHIAHLRIEPDTLVVAGGQVRLIEFGSSTVAATPDQLATDQAQLLATSAAAIGIERALDVATHAIGTQGIERVFPYLQTAAFGSGLRAALKAADVDPDELRAATATRPGVEPPELARLRRVTWGSLIRTALMALAAAAIISAFGAVDVDQLRDDLADASWAWIVVAFLVGQTPRIFQAISTAAAVPARLKLGPVYAMQLAIGFMNLALPSAIARMAVNVRFFQRQGVSPPVAITAGTIDSFVGNVVQVIMLILLLIFTPFSIGLSVESPDSGGSRLLALLVVVLVVVALAFLLIRRLRDPVLAAIRRWWPEVRGALATLTKSNKLLTLVLANVAAELLFAITLGLFAHALGYSLPIAQLLVINISVSLFASLIPIPGGIGVVEGAMMVGLETAGLPAESALAVTILYRMTTFYLPPLWGWFAMRWLQEHRYL